MSTTINMDNMNNDEPNGYRNKFIVENYLKIHNRITEIYHIIQFYYLYLLFLYPYYNNV